MEQKLLTVKETVEYLKDAGLRVSKSTLRNWEIDPESALLKPKRFGGRVVRYSKKDLDALISC